MTGLHPSASEGTLVATLRPPLDRLDQLVTPLTEPEREVAEALATLDDGWTVYVQPRIGLSRPAFVALHEQNGVCAIEIAGWRPGEVRQGAQGVIKGVDDNGIWTPVADHPRFEASRNRALIYDQYFALPSDGTEPTQTVRAIVVAPRLSDREAVTLLSHPWVAEADRAVAVWGGDALRERIDEIVYGSGCAHPEPQSIERLRRHLVSSELAAGAHAPIPLSVDAKRIASNPTGDRIRRVRGAAGSGKSFGLAARAARLAAEGREVLVLSFNITLANRLRSLVDDRCAEYGANPTRVTCANFHSFCTRVVQDAGLAGIETSAPDGLRWPDAIVLKAEQAFAAGFSRKYDAVLVDEGQDYAREWWELLENNAVAPNGEMLLVADPTQDLYDMTGWLADEGSADESDSHSWIDLSGSYRMPRDVAPIAERFALDLLSQEPLSGSADFDPLIREIDSGSVRRWRTVERVTEVGREIGREVVRLLRTNEDLTPADVVFLCEYHHDGVAAVAEIESAGYPVHHIFSRDPDDARRRRKYRFWPDADAIKGCTVHSFKGWDARALVLGIGVEERSKRLAYVAMTRLRCGGPGEHSYLTVVNADRRLAAAQESFESDGSLPPDFATDDASAQPTEPLTATFDWVPPLQ